MIIYDFGAGKCREAGVITVDADPANNPDIVSDITGDTGIPAGSADEVRCNHVLEHIPWPRHFDALREICRVLKRGGRFVIKVPHPSHDSAMVPGHVHVLAPHYWRDIQRAPKAYMGCDLVIDSIEEPLNVRGKIMTTPQRDGEPAWKPEWALTAFRNVCDETVVTGHRL